MAEKLVFLVSSAESGALPAAELKKRFGRYRICGARSLDKENSGEIIRTILLGAADAVLLNGTGEAAKLIRACREMGIPVYDAGKAEPVCGIRKRGFGARFAKRLLDVAGSTVGLLFTALLLPAVAAAICVKSPGPVFFAQERIGLNGRRFRLYKFRTMCVDAEARKGELASRNKMRGFLFKVDNDPRVIPGIGAFLRRTGLDELPQMWNVLRGEMSLVGTRPPTVDEFERYEPRHKSRLAVKPGITGLWQSGGRKRETDFERVVEIDNEYIREQSLVLDLKILLKTAFVIFEREKSA